jgi:hypothetical protein
LGINLTLVTWDECPTYWLNEAFSTGFGNLKSLTIPKSSPVAKTDRSGDLSQALTSEPSAQGGNIP